MFPYQNYQNSVSIPISPILATQPTRFTVRTILRDMCKLIRPLACWHLKLSGCFITHNFESSVLFRSMRYLYTVNPHSGYMHSILHVNNAMYLNIGRFHPFYRPRRPLGRVEVQIYS
jgi:hypothetical protein